MKMTQNEKTGIAKIITVYYGREGFQPINTEHYDLNKEFTHVMGLVADAYERHNGQADYCMVDSNEISDICLSSQCFFEEELEEALGRKGISDVKVQAICGGCYDYVIGQILKSCATVEFLEGTPYPANPVLYKFQRQSEQKREGE
jgi:hypothetical protein